MFSYEELLTVVIETEEFSIHVPSNLDAELTYRLKSFNDSKAGNRQRIDSRCINSPSTTSIEHNHALSAKMAEGVSAGFERAS